jgi:glycosyltransferase involved in cell wall biosynthesis
VTVNSFAEAKAIIERRRKENPRCSICIASYDKPKLLERTLDSILRQNFACEIIVVDDGSPETETGRICADKQVVYYRIEREPGYRNPSFARNIAYKLAKTDIIIAQSDDVVHESPYLLKGLCELGERECHLASVRNAVFSDSGILMRQDKWYVHSDFNPRPLFFLGSLWRKDLCAIGGNEEWNPPGHEDDLFAVMLSRGPRLNVVYRDELLGFHQNHSRPSLRKCYRESESLFNKRYDECRTAGKWCSGGGPWEYVQGKPVTTIDGLNRESAKQESRNLTANV